MTLDNYDQIPEELDWGLCLSLPIAEALVPLNVHRWGSYTIGTGIRNEANDLMGFCEGPASNFESVMNYLDTPPSDAAYNERFTEVLDDTLKVNAMCEIGGDAGAVAAGAYATHKAQKYFHVHASDVHNRTVEDSLAVEIMKRDVKKRGGDPSLVRGTGTFKQHVNPNVRTNPLTGPRPNNYRPIWAYKHIKPLSYIDVAIIGFRFVPYRPFIKNIVVRRFFLICNFVLLGYLYICYARYIVVKVLATIEHARYKRLVRGYVKRIVYSRRAKISYLF